MSDSRPKEKRKHKKRHHKDEDDKTVKKQKSDKMSESDKPKAPPPPFDMTTAQAVELEYAVTQMQEAARRILRDGPNLEQLAGYVKKLSDSKPEYGEIALNPPDPSKEDSVTSRIMVLARNQKVQLAAMLKTLYEDGKLPFFKQVAEFDETTKLTVVEPVRLQLESQPTEEELAVQASNNGAVHKMRYAHVTGMPDLPLIEDVAIEARVFIHKSLVNSGDGLSEVDLLRSHNERLEFLGDSILGTATTLILYNRYPNANEGDLSILRAQLVKNETLERYSRQYGFDKKLHRTSEASGQIRQGKQKVIADVFEAYVGGLFISGNYSNFEEIKAWLGEVMAADLARLKPLSSIKKKEVFNRNAKAQLYALIGSAFLHPRYEIVKKGDGASVDFEVKCMMGNEMIGHATSKSAKDAGTKAAMQALANPEIMQKYSQLRQDTPRTLSVQREKIPEKKEPSESSVPKLDPSVALPIEVTEWKGDDFASAPWKGELYKYLGEHHSLPAYKSELFGDLIKTTLSINSVSVCFCVDANGKVGGQRCARYILEHRELFERCFVF